MYVINLNQPKVYMYTLDGQGSARSDHQGEDNTQTHQWQRLWQLTEYIKLQTASGFKRTLQSPFVCLHSDILVIVMSSVNKYLSKFCTTAEFILELIAMYVRQY